MRQKQISGRTLTFEERICTILQAVDRVPHRWAIWFEDAPRVVSCLPAVSSSEKLIESPDSF